MKRILFIATLLLSFLFYYFAPITYDRSFCFACLLLFCADAIIIIRDDIKRIGFLNFNLLFLFSFFVCSYVYPIFLLGRKSIIGALIENDLNTFDTVNRCVSLCTLAICAYGASYVFTRKPMGVNVSKRDLIESSIVTKNLKVPMVAVCLAMLAVLINFFLTSHEVSIEVTDSPYLFQIFYFMLPLFLVCSALSYSGNKKGVSNLKAMIKGNEVILILLFVMFLFFLYIGDRAPMIIISLTIIVAFTMFVIKVKPFKLVCAGLIGVLLMFALRVTRGGESSLSDGGLDTFVQATQSSIMENASPWDLLADLVGINMELNSGMDYVDNHGLLFTGANLLINITAPLPFVPTFLSRVIYNKLPVEVTPGPIIGEYTNTSAGNHCVIDIYMPFGVVGVVFVFLILGWGVSKLSNGLYYSLFCKVFYVCLVSFAIFAARNSITNYYRTFVLSYIIYYMLLHFGNRVNCLK